MPRVTDEQVNAVLECHERPGYEMTDAEVADYLGVLLTSAVFHAGWWNARASEEGDGHTSHMAWAERQEVRVLWAAVRRFEDAS